MKLKTYQQDTLDTLRRFLEATTVAGPKAAYEKITAEEEVAQRLRGYGGTYEPLAELPDVPYVCIRLPTGGGKTVLAAHAIRIARETVLEREYPMVLWLVPSNSTTLSPTR